MYIHPTIKQNFTTLLRAGAFGITSEPLEITSTFKWSRLEEIAARLGVTGYIASGARLLNTANILPTDFNTTEPEEVFSEGNARLFSILKQKRFEKICDSEPHDIAPSMETLYLLRLIVSISNEIVTSTLPLSGIITLGRYLRNDGHKVDFVKLETWIRQLGIVQLASLQSALLVELFDFDANEFPYIHKKYANAIKHYDSLFNRSLKNNTEFSTSSRMNIAMVETFGYHLGRFSTRITNIEE